MICKTFEIRDRATFMPVLAIQLDPAGERERYLLARAGFGASATAQATYILLVPLTYSPPGATSDPYAWESGARTLPLAHRHIRDHWNELSTGDVIDVEYLEGERTAPKRSEQFTYRGPE